MVHVPMTLVLLLPGMGLGVLNPTLYLDTDRLGCSQELFAATFPNLCAAIPIPNSDTSPSYSLPSKWLNWGPIGVRGGLCIMNSRPTLTGCVVGLFV